MGSEKAVQTSNDNFDRKLTLELSISTSTSPLPAATPRAWIAPDKARQEHALLEGEQAHDRRGDDEQSRIDLVVHQD